MCCKMLHIDVCVSFTGILFKQYSYYVPILIAISMIISSKIISIFRFILPLAFLICICARFIRRDKYNQICIFSHEKREKNVFSFYIGYFASFVYSFTIELNDKMQFFFAINFWFELKIKIFTIEQSTFNWMVKLFGKIERHVMFLDIFIVSKPIFSFIILQFNKFYFAQLFSTYNWEN